MRLSVLIWFFTGLLIGGVLIGVAFATSPGDSEDPLVSLSYLKAGSAFRPISLEAGEKLTIAPGEEFILLDGDIRLECVGSFTACDVSKGKLYKDPKSVDRNHLVIIIGNSSVSLSAQKESTCLVRGVTLE